MSVDVDLLEVLERARRGLLDLTARNRLISTPRGASRGRKLEIVDEKSEEVFRLLVRERKGMSFLPGAGEEGESAASEAGSSVLPQPEESAAGASDTRYTDLRLQTRLRSEQLQSRLLAIYYDSLTFEQEQGVSILYLACGFLKWYESPSSGKERFAPLLLIPVDLERPSATSRFRIRYREEDIATNLSLQAKLKAEFGVELPDVPDVDDLSPTAYYDAVDRAIADRPHWEVCRDDMVLWFFSFAKYLMYRDLDPSTWPAHAPLGQNPTLNALLRDGFPHEPPLCGDGDKIDPLIPPRDMIHVTDADSSQAVVIEEVRRGRHLVVQGPPGTGKSQTITNIIAAAVKEGKRVLFVAEKLAALEVVHRRLMNLGLGNICLELHSHKASKRAVLEDLARTLSLGRPKLRGSTEQFEALEVARERLNRHAAIMNTPIEPCGLTPFQILGRLVHLYGQGAEAIDFVLDRPESWTIAEFHDRCQRLRDLQTHLRDLGPPSEHPWRGVTREVPVLPADRQVLLNKIKSAIESFRAIDAASGCLADLLAIPRDDVRTLKGIQYLGQLGLRLVKAPPMDRSAIGDAVWSTGREVIAQVVREGQRLEATRAEWEHRVAEVAWQTDLGTTRRHLAAHGRSLFRWLHRDYRAAVDTLRGITVGELPKTIDARLQIVDAVIQIQTLSRSLDTDPTTQRLGTSAFGTDWRGARSDWPRLEAILQWDQKCRDARLPWDHRRILAGLERSDAGQLPLKTLSDHLKPAFELLQDISKAIGLDVSDAFGATGLILVPVEVLIARLEAWRDAPEALSQWIAYRQRRRQLETDGLGTIVMALHESRVGVDAALDQFQVAYYQAIIREVFRRYSQMAEFDGRTYEQWIEEFRDLDRKRIELARYEVAAAHYDAIPRGSAGGEMAIVRREIEKKKRHKSIRQLIKEAGSAVLAIKPVFLMSPISLAQFLEPGSVEFDLLLIDEASQVSPVDALGAMARAKQVVVVGDTKQLPPTRFFSKMLDDDGTGPGDDDVNAGDLESVLGLCVAQGMPQRMLRWHYRSRHHSLIAVSNREFYGDNLFIVPSPTTGPARQGLHFRLIPEGVYDRGKSATNRAEAKVIAQAVIEHARQFPNQSLGVGAFSISQRDAIRDELESALRRETGLESFFATGRPEPFFVKNLENIQGDERDVIFISVGYARDSSGYLEMKFGPLADDGGERRLNVLITRARERCEVFSSITADDIDLQRARSRGAAAFKTFLRYAASGILDTPYPTGRGHDSDFERQVARALEGLGYEVHCQVGTAGFSIDLAVVDPECPGRYLLGIECDGATYHSSRSARDRDRLREQVLKDRGWRIHRIWSTDWFHRPEEQLRKVVAAIEQARISTAPAEPTPEPPPGGDPGSLERGDSTSVNSTDEHHATWVVPYVEAALEVPSDTAIPETPLPILTSLVSRVVEIEGPIHRVEVARRIASIWGLQRTGSRIVESTEHAIQAAVREGLLTVRSDFVRPSQQETIPVRCRLNVASPNLRKPEMLPPEEIQAALLRLLAGHVGMQRAELFQVIGKLLGFKATSSKLREVIEAAIDALVAEGAILEREGKLGLS